MILHETHLNRQISIYRERRDLFRGAAALVRGLAEASVRDHGYFTLVLSGGKTPEGLYELLAGDEREGAGAGMPWSKVLVFWGDERFVPPEHPESNCGMARRSLLSKAAVPEENIFPIPTGAGTPEQAALIYEETIMHEKRIRREGDAPSALPSFDLILLGMGKDGHTASLYPESAALAEKSRLVCAAKAPGADALEPSPVGTQDAARRRITMTLPLINNSLYALILVTGEDKKETLLRVLSEHETSEKPHPEAGHDLSPAEIREKNDGLTGRKKCEPPGKTLADPPSDLHPEPLPAQLVWPRNTLYFFTDISIWQI